MPESQLTGTNTYSTWLNHPVVLDAKSSHDGQEVFVVQLPEGTFAEEVRIPEKRKKNKVVRPETWSVTIRIGKKIQGTGVDEDRSSARRIATEEVQRKVIKLLAKLGTLGVMPVSHAETY